MKRLNKKGVSLAELLAVVVIMGIIAAIAIPLVGNVIETANKKAYLGDLTTITEAARTYCAAEGKDTEGFCKKGGTANASVLAKYVSKDLGKINNSKIEIRNTNGIYEIRTDNKKHNQGYTTYNHWIDVTKDNQIDLLSKKSYAVASGEVIKEGMASFKQDLKVLVAEFDAKKQTINLKPSTFTASKDTIGYDQSTHNLNELIATDNDNAVKAKNLEFAAEKRFNTFQVLTNDSEPKVYYITASRGDYHVNALQKIDAIDSIQINHTAH